MKREESTSRSRRRPNKVALDYANFFSDEDVFVEFVKKNIDTFKKWTELKHSYWWCYATFSHAKSKCDELRKTYTQEDHLSISPTETKFWRDIKDERRVESVDESDTEQTRMIKAWMKEQWKEYKKSQTETVSDEYLCSQYLSHVLEQLDTEELDPKCVELYETKLRGILNFVQDQAHTPDVSTYISWTLDVMEHIQRTFFHDSDLKEHLQKLNKLETGLFHASNPDRWGDTEKHERRVIVEQTGRYGAFNTFQINPKNEAGDEEANASDADEEANASDADEEANASDADEEANASDADEDLPLLSHEYVIYNIFQNEEIPDGNIETSDIYKNLSGKVDLTVNKFAKEIKPYNFSSHLKVLEAYDVGFHRDKDSLLNTKTLDYCKKVQKMYAQKVVEAEKEVTVNCPLWVCVHNYVLSMVVTHAINSVATLCDVIHFEGTDYFTCAEKLVDLQKMLLSALTILCALSRYHNLVDMFLQPADISVNGAIMPHSKEDVLSMCRRKASVTTQLQTIQLKKFVVQSLSEVITEYMTKPSKSSAWLGNSSEKSSFESSRAYKILSENNWNSMGYNAQQMIPTTKRTDGLNLNEAVVYFKDLLDHERWRLQLFRMTAMLVELQNFDQTTGIHDTKRLCMEAYYTSRMLVIDTLCPPVDTPCLRTSFPNGKNSKTFYMDSTKVYVPVRDLEQSVKKYLPYLENPGGAPFQLSVKVEKGPPTTVRVEETIMGRKGNFSFENYNSDDQLIDGYEAITLHHSELRFFRYYFHIIYKSLRPEVKELSEILNLSLVMCIVLKQCVYGLYCANLRKDVLCYDAACKNQFDLGKLTCMTREDIGFLGYSLTKCAVCLGPSYHTCTTELPDSSEDCARRCGATIVHTCKAQSGSEYPNALDIAKKPSQWMICKPCKEKSTTISVCLVGNCGVLKDDDCYIGLELKAMTHYYKAFRSKDANQTSKDSVELKIGVCNIHLEECNITEADHAGISDLWASRFRAFNECSAESSIDHFNIQRIDFDMEESDDDNYGPDHEFDKSLTPAQRIRKSIELVETKLSWLLKKRKTNFSEYSEYVNYTTQQLEKEEDDDEDTTKTEPEDEIGDKDALYDLLTKYDNPGFYQAADNRSDVSPFLLVHLMNHILDYEDPDNIDDTVPIDGRALVKMPTDVLVDVMGELKQRVGELTKTCDKAPLTISKTTIVNTYDEVITYLKEDNTGKKLDSKTIWAKNHNFQGKIGKMAALNDLMNTIVEYTDGVPKPSTVYKNKDGGETKQEGHDVNVLQVEVDREKGNAKGDSLNRPELTKSKKVPRGANAPNDEEVATLEEWDDYQSEVQYNKEYKQLIELRSALKKVYEIIKNKPCDKTGVVKFKFSYINEELLKCEVTLFEKSSSHGEEGPSVVFFDDAAHGFQSHSETNVKDADTSAHGDLTCSCDEFCLRLYLHVIETTAMSPEEIVDDRKYESDETCEFDGEEEEEADEFSSDEEVDEFSSDEEVDEDDKPLQKKSKQPPEEFKVMIKKMRAVLGNHVAHIKEDPLRRILTFAQAYNAPDREAKTEQ
eukprot:gene87-130_t